MTTSTGDELRAAVDAQAHGTPYRMLPTPAGFDLRIDVADARWYGLLGAAGLRKVVEHRVVLDEDRRTLTMTDDHLDVRWKAGVAAGTSAPQLVAAAQVRRSSGRTYEFAFHRTWGIDRTGTPAQVVDFTFRSEEGHALVRAAAAGLGWKEQAGRDERIGRAVAGAGIGLAVLVGGAVAVLAATSRF